MISTQAKQLIEQPYVLHSDGLVLVIDSVQEDGICEACAQAGVESGSTVFKLQPRVAKVSAKTGNWHWIQSAQPDLCEDCLADRAEGLYTTIETAAYRYWESQ